MSQEIQTILAELKGALPGFDTKFSALERRIDEMEVRGAALRGAPGSGALFGGAAIVDGIMKDLDTLKKSGRLIFETPSIHEGMKAFIASTGIVNPEGEGVIHGAGKFKYTLRSIFRDVPISTGSAYRIRSTAENINASPQVNQGDTKSESTFTFGAESVQVATIAHFVNIAKQAFDDVPGMAAFLDAVLLFGLERKVEQQIISGDGTTGNLEGITTVATAFDTTILSAGSGYQRADVLAAAATQLVEGGFRPSFFVIHPRDEFRLRITKTTTGEYVLGSPKADNDTSYWRMQGIVTPAITQGKFIVGDASQAVIRQRQTATIDTSNSHGSNFTANLLTILAEERLAFVTMRDEAFVYGNLVTSPL